MQKINQFREFPTYTGRAEWAIGTVKTILTNPTYTAKARWNDRMQTKTLVNGNLVSSEAKSFIPVNICCMKVNMKGLLMKLLFMLLPLDFIPTKQKQTLN